MGPQGMGLGGAEVLLTLQDGEIRETTSDAAGAFRFDTLPEGLHRLTVSRGGFADRTVEIRVGAEGEVRISIPLALAFAEEVTVTGQQLERAVRDEAASVAVVTGARLDGGTDTDLYRVVAMTPNAGASSEVRGFSIRGISQSGFAADGGLLVSVKVDGATVQGGQGTFFGPFATWDLDRVEIFRGPQSTQQGRNSLAGAIVMKSADPIYRTEIQTRARLGNAGASQAAAVVNLPIVMGRAALRVAVDSRRSDGFVANPTRDEDSYDFRNALTVRAKLRFDPSERFGGLLTLSHADSRGGDGVIGLDRFPAERTSLSDHDAEDGSRHRTAALEMVWHPNAALSLESSSSLYFHDYLRSEDLDRTPAPAAVLDYTTEDVWTTQELRLRYSGPGRRRGVLGLYFADLDDRLRADAAGPGELAGLPPSFVLTSFFETEEDTRNAALFGEFDLGPADHWILTLGARYDRESRETRHLQGLVADPPHPAFPAGPSSAAPISAQYGALLPKAAITREWSDAVTTSIGWQRGYRAGGRSVAVLSQQTSDFEPEFTDNYELALRAAAPDRRWSLSANLFYTDWRDQQVRVMTELGLPVDTLTVNAGRSTVAGFEAEARYWLGRGVELYGSFGRLRTRFDEFRDGERDFAGNEFPHAPAWSAFAGLSFEAAELWFGNLEVASQADSFAAPENDPRFRVGGRTLLNTRFGTRRGHFGVFAFGRNLLDEAYLLDAWASDVPLFSGFGRAGAPRSFGIELDFRY